MDLDFEKYKEDQFCSTSNCKYFGQVGAGNIGTKSSKHHQVYCNDCKSIWVITKDTFFFNLKKPVPFILEVLLLLSEGMGVNAVCRAKGVKAETVNRWVLKASDHVREVTVYLETGMHLTQCQIDEFWSFIYKKKQILEKRSKREKIEEIAGGL